MQADNTSNNSIDLNNNLDAGASKPDHFLLQSVLCYAGGIIIFVISLILAGVFPQSGSSLVLLVYLAIGFVLNRKILRPLGFHPVYDTLYNLSRAKLWAFLLWPLAYFMLIFRLFITKVL